MAKRRKKIKPAIKRKLMSEVGNKCANPGCANWRVHIHHIKHWIVYQINDEKEMIAVCPACHDEIHFGKLRISDDTLYSWKKLHHSSETVNSHLYIEPGTELKILAGTIAIALPNQEAAVFELSQKNRLKFRILDNDIMLLNSNISDLLGNEVLRVVDNHIRSRSDKDIVYNQAPGHTRISIPASDRYVPVWAMDQIRTQQADYGKSGEVIALDLEVLKPGLVRVQGVWTEEDVGVIITKDRLSLVTPTTIRSLVGKGEHSVLIPCGPINTALFEFK